ncbi:MAG: HAD family hydrolase [Rhodanobacter sp.]|nr:MAG: HAD family hydrolase [Rhodanobacter sp.]TAM13914.1 MAG: HAD family hydrolase [Rhodanobacter sp.]TAM37756.1 MAG: HAD family hydrolase [Rhodanobacter sp.]
MQVRALSLDLDDTLWPVAPALEEADRAVDAYLQVHFPRVAHAWPIPAMRTLRMQVAEARPELAHDFTAQRQLTLHEAFARCGIVAAPIDTLWEIYFSARNTVSLFPDSLPALAQLAARWPLASLTNGNADLARIGLQAHFRCAVAAREVGVGKPDPRIFRVAANRLGVAAGELLHVGDDPELDVLGAHRAGLHTAWVNRRGLPWPTALGTAPDVTVRDLGELVRWLDADAGT